MYPSNHLCICLLLLLLHLLPLITTVTNSLAYTATDLILLNCGASSRSTSLDGRYWDADATSKFLPSNSETTSISLQLTKQHPSISQVPYTTARFFNSTFTYTFPVSPGPKFLRLYFNPAASYSNFNTSESLFSVKANNYTLRSATQPPFEHGMREFIITVGENQSLNLTFNPSLNSSAFINGIEIVSIPDDLYTRSNIPLKFVGSNYLFYLDSSYAFETVYRMNVGGAYIDSIYDTGMYRTWVQDSDYIYGAGLGLVSKSSDNVSIKYTSSTPAFVAPELVYSTIRSMGRNPMLNLNYNLTWVFSVDSGFNYLVRLHFCETRLEVNVSNTVVFSIFINNQTAEEQTNVIYLTGGTYIPMYKDYVVWVPKGSLWIALHPFTDIIPKPSTNDAFLNGLEIIKLNNSVGSLAGSNQNPPRIAVPSVSPSSEENSKMKSKLGPVKVIKVVGFLFCGILVLSVSVVTLFFICKQRRLNASAAKSIKAKSFQLRTSAACNHFRQFSIFEIEVATATFDDEFVIGSGGFGNVYKGLIDDGVTLVAIKRLHSSSKQGAKEFRTEIQLLPQLRHQHLVSLIGYCDDPGEMILVYEYMQRGALRDHLYKTKNPPLPWKKRLEMCIGAARGLHYLHTGAKHPIIHRDVKSMNILVDENWVAKVSDFGLSRMGPTSESQTHVSTVVRGSFGYVDPEYYRRQHLTEKSDVYSFGVVLFEVLCGRPPVIPGLPREQVNLCDWGRMCYRRGVLGQIMDPNLVGDIDPVCLVKFGEICDSCVRDQGTERPTMGDVVMELEMALHLQETAQSNRIRGSEVVEVEQESESPFLMPREAAPDNDDDDDHDEDLFSGSCGEKGDLGSTFSSGGRSLAQSDAERFRSHTVFSELGNHKGR
ncbi:receptor-like protein kinase FERONIA [Euphorbia lathyris]|uniref:receptor-like protein kinase FERONIA n=1 Tax=Euphorbia lathyris TaxID=212925 RepID=UPI003313A9CE